jgi:hypothetical protein
MERPQALPNLWLIVRTVAWVMALEGVAEFLSDYHWHTLLRWLVDLAVERDPSKPRLPDNWAEWYNS